MQEERRRVVAAFDFDGTLTKRDTLLPFLRYLCGPRAVVQVMARHGAALGVAIAFDRHEQRATIKEKVLRDLLVGRRHDDVCAAGERFARNLGHASKLRAEMISRWRWHAKQDHTIVVVSASLEAYVEPVVRGLGGGEVVATRLCADGRGLLTGDFDGFNCRGPEKVRRLREWGLDASAQLWAYGDSSGDRELLTAAHMPHRIGRGTRVVTPPLDGTGKLPR